MNHQDKQYCISILKRARDKQGSEFPSKPYFDMCLEIAKSKAISVREVPRMETVICQGKTGVFMFSLPDCSFRFSSSEDGDTEAEDRFWEEVMQEACAD